jgi:uncharacterized membrane protein
MASAAAWSRRLRVLAAAALVAYPLVVWLGLPGRSPRVLAVVLLALMAPLAPLALLRIHAARRADLRGLAAIPLITVASLVGAALLDDAGFVLVVPVAINALLLLTFAASLRPGSTPMITRFARLEAGALTPQQELWCRAWTCAWCLFFVANGAAAGLLAWLAPLAWWALYTGGLSYGLVAALIVLERLLRRRRFPAVAPGAAGAR